MTKPVSAFAPAKINLCLHVTGPRPDGYHALESLVVFADARVGVGVGVGAGTRAGDFLEARSAVHDHLLVAGPFAKFIKADNSNLILRALAAFRSRWPDRVKTGVEIKLTKNLPVAAGIGGGSSDAAAALRIMAQMSDSAVCRTELMALALELGSDVPVCLQMRPALMGGVGEKLAPVPTLPEMHMVLVNPGLLVGTKEVFSKLTRRKNPPMPKLPPRFDSARSLVDWLETTRNDLVEPASGIVPQIKEITGFLRADQNCLFARMSGSGATIFALYYTRQTALDGAGRLKKRWPEYWVSATSIGL